RRLAEHGCAFVDREQRIEVLLPFARLGLHDAPLFEAQTDATQLSPVEERRVAEADLAACGRLDRRGEDLAFWHAHQPLPGQPRPALEAERQVSALPEEAQLAHRIEARGPRAQLC